LCSCLEELSGELPKAHLTKSEVQQACYVAAALDEIVRRFLASNHWDRSGETTLPPAAQGKRGELCAVTDRVVPTRGQPA
jgi:hypothetical protein